MLAPHGWKSNPSPRRGFTVVEASREVSTSPVVVAVRDSTHALRLFRTALDEAMTRAHDLVVLDYGTTSLRDALQGESADVNERERRAMRALWTNQHVNVLRQEPLEWDLGRTVSYCESVNASLIVVGADEFGSASIDPDLANRLFNAEFDVLVVTGHSPKEQPGPGETGRHGR